MAKLKALNQHVFDESNMPELDIILVVEAWSVTDCDDEQVAQDFESQSLNKSRISQFFLRMDDTRGGVFTQEGVRAEANALLHDILDLRKNDTEKPPILFVAQGFGGIILKQALALLPRTIEELNDLSRYVWATLFVCSIHTWKDEETLKSALEQILTAQHGMDHTTALQHSVALAEVISDTNIAFYDSKAMFRSRFMSIVPTESAFPQSMIYRTMGSIHHPLEENIQAACSYRQMLYAVSCHPLLYRRSDRPFSATQTLDVHLVATFRYAVPQYPDPCPSNDHLMGISGQDWTAWIRSAGTSFKLARVDPTAYSGRMKSSCSISKLLVGEHFGFSFDFSSSVGNYTSMNAFLWSWLSQLLSCFKARWISAEGSSTITPDKLSQHFDAVDKAYGLGDDDLLRMCLCTLKDNLVDTNLPALLILNNVDTGSHWQMSLITKLHEAFRGSHSVIKILITSLRIDKIEEYLSNAPEDMLHQHSEEGSPGRPKPCKTRKPSLLQSRNRTAWYIFRRHYPVVPKLRAANIGLPALLQNTAHRELQETEGRTSSMGMVCKPKSHPTKPPFDRSLDNPASMERSLEEIALAIVLRCMRPLKKKEFEAILNVATNISPNTSNVTYEEVEKLFGGRLTILQGRVLLVNDVVRETLRPHGTLADVQQYDQEIRSHSDMADWCLRYLQLPENRDALNGSGKGDGKPWFNTSHSLLWYAVDHWAEHARRSEGCWNPNQSSFQSLLADNMTVLSLWAVATSLRQPAMPSATVRPRTALTILAQHGLHSAVELVANLVRGRDTFGDELAGAFIAAASSGHLATVRFLTREAELRQFDVDQAVLAAIESRVNPVLVEVIDCAIRLGLKFDDTAAYLGRAASLDSMVAVQVVREKVLIGKPLEELSQASFPISLACYTDKPDMLLAMMKLGLSPSPGDINGWHQPMETVARYGGSALIKPLLEHIKSIHPMETELLTSMCGASLQKADAYGQCAVISSILDWASANSLVELNQAIIYLSAAFWSNTEDSNIVTPPFKKPRVFEDGEDLFKRAVISFASKSAFRMTRELLQPPLIMGETTFCGLLRTSIIGGKERMVRLICSVGARSLIDMTCPAVRDIIFWEDHVSRSIENNFIAPLLEYKMLDPNIEIPQLGHRSMLGYAAYKNKLDAARALLAAGAKVDAGGDDWTPLHCAYDNTEITGLLLENGADVNIKDVSNRSALYFASKWGHGGVVSAILQRTPHRDTLEQSLGVALENSQTHIARLLIKNDDDLTTESSEAGAWLSAAVSASDAALVDLILDRCRGLDINQPGSDEWAEAPLHFISHATEVSIARTLAARGADVNILNGRKETPLWKAAAADNLGVARCLVRRGATVDGCQGQPDVLSEACQSASPEFVKFLVDEGADVNTVRYTDPGTALHAALLRKEEEGGNSTRKAQIIDYLLKMDGINVRVRSRLWGSVLNAAAMECHPSIVVRLLQMGVAANDVDHLGRQPIHFALLQSVEMAQLLLGEEGVTLDGEDRLGRHALHFAVQSQRPEVVEFILRERPLLVSKPDIHGWTPLLWALRAPPTFRNSATEGKLKEILKLLLGSGASKFVKGGGADGEVWTPAKLASYRNLSVDVLEMVMPSEAELRQRQEGDSGIWTVGCDRRGKLQSEAYCNVCLAAGDGEDYQCSEADYTIAMFYICWKCALSKALLHPGSAHVLVATGVETVLGEGSVGSGGEDEETETEEEEDETDEEQEEEVDDEEDEELEGDDDEDRVDGVAKKDGVND